MPQKQTIRYANRLLATSTKKDQEQRKPLVSLKARQDGQEQQKTEIGYTAMEVLELDLQECKS